MKFSRHFGSAQLPRYLSNFRATEKSLNSNLVALRLRRSRMDKNLWYPTATMRELYGVLQVTRVFRTFNLKLLKWVLLKFDTRTTAFKCLKNSWTYNLGFNDVVCRQLLCYQFHPAVWHTRVHAGELSPTGGLSVGEWGRPPWGRHDMETIYALLALCESTGRRTVDSLHKGLVMCNFDFFCVCAFFVIALVANVNYWL